MEWSNLKHVLAVGRYRSLQKAARALSVDPTTVSRRITAIEEDLGVTLFVRSRRLWRTTVAGEEIVAGCERIDAEVLGLERSAARLAARAEGRVRITAMDAIITRWLVPKLPLLREAHPDIQVEFFATNENVDLHRGHADIALRMSRPQPLGLRVKRLTTVPLVVAGRAELAAMPKEERPVILIGYRDSAFPENDLVKAYGGPVAGTATSFAVVVSLVQSGAGIGLLPQDLAEQEHLAQLSPSPAYRTLYRAIPEDLAKSPRIKATAAWLDEVFTTPPQSRS